MKKLTVCLISFLLLQHTSSYAEEPDYYSECTNQFEAMNNSVVYECAEEAKEAYNQSIQRSLAKLRRQATDSYQAEKYQNILKAQQAWEKYVALECKNAGNYIGSPMYSFCPMQEYKSRSITLAEYVQ